MASPAAPGTAAPAPAPAPAAPAPSPAPSLASVQNSARERLNAATTAPEAPAAPAAVPPAPPAAAAAPPSSAPAGSPPAGAAPAPTTINLNDLTPEARRFLEMNGGNLGAALAKGLEYNNRLGNKGQAAPAAPGDPAAAAPAPTEAAPAAAATPAPATPPAEPPPAAITEEQWSQRLEETLSAALKSDRDCAAWIGEFNTHNERLNALGKELEQGGKGEIATLQRSILKAEAKKDMAESLGDEGTKAEAVQELRDLKQELGLMKLEAQEARGRIKELDGSYKERFAQHREQIEGELTAEQRQADSDARITRHAADFQGLWTAASPAAATNVKIPQTLHADFDRVARLEATYHIDTKGPIQDLNVWMNEAATRYMTSLDKYHREQSAEYARAATERAGNPAPTTPAGGPPPAVQPATPQVLSLKDVYARTTQRLAALRQGA